MRHVQGKDGRFAGSIGDGKTSVPTASTVPSRMPRTSDQPGEYPAGGYADMQKAVSEATARHTLAVLDADTAWCIALVHAGGEPAAQQLEDDIAHGMSLARVADAGGWSLSGRDAMIGAVSGIPVETIPPADRARLVCAAAHRGQRDKLGVPYLMHPYGVHQALTVLPEFRRLSQEDQRHAEQVAYLHDVLEDTSVTERDLRAMGFSEKVVTAVVALTVATGSPRSAYYAQVRDAGPVAVAVKLADLGHNTLPSRRAELPGAPGRPAADEKSNAYARLGRKYAAAYAALGSAVPEHLREFSTR